MPLKVAFSGMGETPFSTENENPEEAVPGKSAIKRIFSSPRLDLALNLKEPRVLLQEPPQELIKLRFFDISVLGAVN